MDFIETINQRNEEFVHAGHSADLKIGCLDRRVDPTDILGLKPGEAAIIRNIGGRITSAVVETLTLLPVVSKAAGQEMGAGWNLVILHHTDCGIIGCYKHAPDLLAAHLGVARSQLDAGDH
jgi:carbonic anhydrase